ncbi:hypothetical protein [Paenibacillus sp. CF384]|uniref:hypothetical protein n=1 Tax=Paenibacillus sp. CF384 TaxID=1884382 RepID=UPI00089A0D90|nr:hypothetical protein [Paenibacillus sp. CF384]SDX90101.1 hypothetical protein SAMN05518855_102753 [Paenibacillus sp. CF384]
MSETIELGPLRLDAMLLAGLLSAAVGLAMFKIWLSRSSLQGETNWMDIALNAVICTIIGWKLAFLVRDPELLWERPSALLLVRGSATDTAFGFLLACAYVAYAGRKRNIPLKKLLDVWPYAIIPGCIVWTLLTDFPYAIPYALLLACVYGILFRTGASSRIGSGETASLSLLGTGIGGLFVSLFAAYPPGTLPALTFGLTMLQWLFIALSFIGILMPRKVRING